MKVQQRLYLGETAELGGVSVTCVEIGRHSQGAGPPRPVVVLEYDDGAPQPVDPVEPEEAGDDEIDDED